MTLPTIRTSAIVVGGSNGAIPAITRPAGVLDADYMLVIASAGAGSNASAAPTGFTTVVADTVIQGARLAVYGRLMGADTSITLTYPTAATSGNNIRVAALWLTKAAGVGVKGSVFSSATASATLPIPGITTDGPDQLALVIATSKASSTAFPTTASIAGGATVGYSNFPGSTFNPATVVGVLPQPNPGATNQQIVTWDFSTVNQGGVIIAILPSEVALSLAGVVTPPSADIGVQRTITLTAAGGNGSAITFGPVDWGDGNANSAAQVKATGVLTADFVRTPTVAGLGKTWIASATQAG